MPLKYTKKGDYYFPVIKEHQQLPLSMYVRMKLKYLKEHNQGIYFKLLSTNQLNNYLQTIDKEANEMYVSLLSDFKKQRGVAEEIKEKDRMMRIQEMNNIQNCIDEVIRKEVIEL